MILGVLGVTPASMSRCSLFLALFAILLTLPRLYTAELNCTMKSVVIKRK